MYKIEVDPMLNKFFWGVCCIRIKESNDKHSIYKLNVIPQGGVPREA